MNVYGSQSEDELFVLREWFRSVDQDNSGYENILRCGVGWLLMVLMQRN